MQMGRRKVPCKAYEDRSCAAVIIFRLMKQLGDVLSYCFEISFHAHSVYCGLENKQLYKRIYETMNL